jgi:probable HAF family extracellular repeat protein
MIRFTGWFSKEASAAVQPSGAEILQLAVKQLASPAATASTRRGWSKPHRAAALFSVCVCVTSTANAQWTITDWGDLPGLLHLSRAFGINNSGQVVGYSGAATGDRAFLWQDGVMTDLSTVSGVSGTGWSLIEAAAINDAGQIVGYGRNPQGVDSAFILTPVPESEVYLMMGAGVCLAGVIARRRKQISQ